MTTLWLTHSLHFISPKRDALDFDTGGLRTLVTPGLVDGDWLKGQIGALAFNEYRRAGVLRDAE